MNILAVITTTDSLELARKIAAALVDRRLAACVQISRIESFYAWQGQTQNDDEFRVFVKTTEDRYPDVEAAILELHTYDVPAIVAFPFEHVFEPYADWVVENTSDAAD